MKTLFNFDGVKSTCTIIDGSHTFVGEAICHEEDMDMVSERTGLFIAEGRAIIKRYQHIKNNELKPAIAALKHLQNCMEQSKKFNKNSYENYMLRRQIRIKEEELAVIELEIATEQQYLKEYIAQKTKLYNRIRQSNNQDNNN